MNVILENALLSLGRVVIAEFYSKSNRLTYRQLLDKYAARIEPLFPGDPDVWMILGVYTQRVAAKK